MYFGIGVNRMKYRTLVTWFGVLAVGAPSVCAGFIAPGRSAARQGSPDAVVASQLQAQRLFDSPSQCLLNAVVLEEQPLVANGPAEVPSDFGSASGTGQPAALPPAPESALLAMSGLLSLGAIQLGRNVRKLGLGTLPVEWYHDGGPAQVGHSTPFDLEAGFSALPVCFFAEPPEAGTAVLHRVRGLRPARGAVQCHLTTESPRGPPNLA